MKEIFVKKGRGMGVSSLLEARGRTATSYLIMPWYRKFRLRFTMWKTRKHLGNSCISFGTGYGPNPFFHMRNTLGNEYNKNFYCRKPVIVPELYFSTFQAENDMNSITGHSTELSADYKADDRFLYTKDWGIFKIRKNGKIGLHINGDIIRCTPVKND